MSAATSSLILDAPSWKVAHTDSSCQDGLKGVGDDVVDERSGS